MDSRVFSLIGLLCISCSGIAVPQQTDEPKPQVEKSNIPRNTGYQAGEQNAARPQNTVPFTGDGGKGITIVVPAPVIQNHSPSDAWIPQLFQDAITGDFVRYSAMTVIDRANEQLVLAEQSISVSGNYSDDDYIKMGNLTNAQYIVAGKISKIAGNYSVSFRINHTETNEIKTAFDRTYPLKDIESGLAPKEAVRELLAGMGIQLTEDGEKSLLAIQKTVVRASAQLAKGMAAEKNGDLVEALAHFTGALETDSGMREASAHIQNFSGAVPTGSIRERAEFAQAQKQKWEKIFADLRIYIQENLPIFIYDFSTIEDKFNSRYNNVTITVSPGVKVVPNRTVLLVYKTILDSWFHIRAMEENKEWVSAVRGPRGALSNVIYNLDFPFSYEIGLYDDYGDRIANFRWYGSPPGLHYNYTSSFQVFAQHKYFNDTQFGKIVYTVPLDKITDTITPKIERIYYSTTNAAGKKTVHNTYPVLSVVEWQDWLASQKGTGN